MPAQRGVRRQRNLSGTAAILLAAAVAVAPLAMQGVSCGHDFDFHLLSWMDALNAWRHGVFYPHWTPSANYGAGEPRFIFYPPLTWMLGAALGAIFGWQAAPVVLSFLLLAATGLATRALARHFVGDSGAATLTGCAALFSFYALFCVYERSAYPEITGGFWLPLMLLFTLRERETNPARPSLGRRVFDGSTLPLALTIAGAWLSNDPVGVMACYLLAGFALLLALTRRSCVPILRAAAAVMLGLGLSAFYLVPAAVEQKWVDIAQAIDDPSQRIENSFLFAHHSNPALALHDVELYKASVIAVIMLMLIVAALLTCRLRRKMPGNRKLWLPLLAIPAAVLLLQLPISLPIWNLLPKLRFLQFPWRWLVAVEAPLGIFLACAVWPRPVSSRLVWQRWAVLAACAAAFLGATWFAGTLFYQPCDDQDAVAGMTQAYAQGQGFAGAGQGFGGADEYEPPGADDTLVAEGLPAACLVSNPATPLGENNEDSPPPVWSPEQKSCESFRGIKTGSVEHWRLRGVASSAGYLVLRLQRYPAWKVRLNGQPVSSMPKREDGLMAVPVQAGFVDITADWTTTPDVLLGRWISLFALIATAGLGMIESRKILSQQ